MHKSCVPDMSCQIINGGRIQLIDAIGQGSFGTVYCARDLTSVTPSLLAVKVVPKVPGRLPQQWKEIALHKTVCDHKNVVNLHRVFHDDKFIYIVMDFCATGDLWDAVKDGLYWKNDALVRRVFLQLVDALQWCHRRGVYHRDLKSNNVLVTDNGAKVLLTDFGLSSTFKKSTSFGVGTRQFRSPECHNAERNYQFFDAERNDIWALGVIFANVLSGRLPWSTASEDDESYARHLRHPHHLRHILPISPEANYILQRIFHSSVEFAPSLDDVREMVLRVRTFFMDDDEIRSNARLQKVAEAFHTVSPMPSFDFHNSDSLGAVLDESDDSLLDDSDNSDEHSIGLHSPSLLALEEGHLKKSNSSRSCADMALDLKSVDASLLATPFVEAVEVQRSALITPAQPELTPGQAHEASSATLVTSDNTQGETTGNKWHKLSRSMRRIFRAPGSNHLRMAKA